MIKKENELLKLSKNMINGFQRLTFFQLPRMIVAYFWNVLAGSK